MSNESNSVYSTMLYQRNDVPGLCAIPGLKICLDRKACSLSDGVSPGSSPMDKVSAFHIHTCAGTDHAQPTLTLSLLLSPDSQSIMPV